MGTKWKLFVLLFLLAVCFSYKVVYAQEKTNKIDMPLTEIKYSQEAKALENLILAEQLAKYGRETNTVEALITSIKIVVNTPISKLKAKKISSPIDTINIVHTEKPVPSKLNSINLPALINDAKIMAKGDTNMLKLIEKATIEDDDRGALGGPSYKEDRVLPKSQDTYEILMKSKEIAIVYVSGDGTTNLDLYVYDENNNLVAFDDKPTDECLVKFVPERAAKFKVSIKNKGHYFNDYVLKTN